MLYVVIMASAINSHECSCYVSINVDCIVLMTSPLVSLIQSESVDVPMTYLLPLRERYDKMKDDIAVGYPYVVVQFLQLPYADIDDYSCVPHSWIRGRRATDRKCLILYPDEPPSITKMRIINNDKPSEKWKLYMAIIKLESHSYEDACEFIMGKIHNASRNRYSDIMRIDYNLSPSTTTKRYSPLLKTNKLSDPQSKKNRNRLKVVDKAKLKDMNLNSRKFPEYFNVESRTPSLLELPGFVSSENTVIKENCQKEHQDQTSRDFRPSSDHLLLRYPYIQRKPEKDKGTQVNSPGAGYRSTGKTLYASKCPPTLVNQICDYTLKPEENQLLSIHREYLHQIALTQGIQDSRISNLRTFTLDFPEPLIQDPHIGSNTSFIIQTPTNEANQFSQLEIADSSPVIQEHLQVLPKQKTSDQFSEVECATSEPTAHSKMTSASHASITCTNSSEHQDSIEEDMVVDELTEVSCVEQNGLSGISAENGSSANPETPEEANYSGQTVESSMEEGSPMVEAVTSSGISSTQDVDHDEQSHSSDLSSDEILTTFPNSNEQANQSVISVLNQVDIWADQLYELFQTMKINFSETCQNAHDLHESLVQSQKVIECIANASENLRKLKKGKVAVLTSKEVTVEVQQITEKNQAKKKEEENLNVSIEEDKKENNDVDSKSSENNDDCGGDIKNVKGQDRGNKVPKKTRDHIRTFVLPPEYDPCDTRWTLKYRKNDPKLNLVELVPGSSVFINSLKLAHCKLVAKESKELARMLLSEIFSQSALSVCSLTGVRANAFDISGTNIRPGLDEKARITILSFVKEHALEKKWGPFDSQSVINSLRSKIQDLRAKHAKTA